MSADKKLGLVDSRLKAAKSDNLEEPIRKTAWIWFFQEQIEAAKIQLAIVAKNCKEDWLLRGKFYNQEREDNIDRVTKTNKAYEKRYEEKVSIKRR